MKKFLYLALTIGLLIPRSNASHAGANGTGALPALSALHNQLTALADILEPQETQQETAQRLERQKKFVQQTKAETPEGQELAKVLEEKTEFPPELATLTVGYFESYQLKGTLEGTLNNKAAVFHLLPLPDETLVAGSYNSLKIWDLKNKQLIREIRTAADITSLVALSPNTFASGSSDGIVRIWNIEGKLLREFGKATDTDHFRSMRLAVHRDGKLISALNSASATVITIWDPNSGTKIKETSLQDKFVTSLAITPDGNLVLAEHEHDKAFVMYLDLSTLCELQTIPLPKQDGAIGIVVFPQGTIAASNKQAQSISILSPSTQQGTTSQELSLPARQGFITFFQVLSVLSDGRLASGRRAYGNPSARDQINDIIIWNYDEKSNKWTPQLTLAGHKHTIISLAVLPDGRLVSGDLSGVINIWR